MKLQDLKKYTDAELEALQFEMVKRGNLVAANSIANFKEFYGKTVRVVKGRKVPKGTTGVCFWMGQTNYGKYGDPWGIYTRYRIGIKDDDGEVYWTALDNIELVRLPEAVSPRERS